MTPIDKVKAARRYYLREARKLHTRRDAIVAIQRNNVGDLTPELSQQKREIEEQMHKAGMGLWEVFKKWSEEVCGYKPIRLEDVRKLTQHKSTDKEGEG